MKELENENAMYLICFSLLVVCFISLLLLEPVNFSQVQETNQKISFWSLFESEARITGAVVLESLEGEKETNPARPEIENKTEEEIALTALLQAEEDLKEMQAAGLGIVWVNDALLEAKEAFQGINYTSLKQQAEELNASNQTLAQALILAAQQALGKNGSLGINYSIVIEKTKAISERKVQAFKIFDQIRASELRIEELNQTGLNLSESINLLSLAKIEFVAERYGTAEELLVKVDASIEEVKTEATLLNTLYKAGKDTTLNFIKEHFRAIIIVLVLMLGFTLLLSNRIEIRLLKKKIGEMEIEEEVLIGLMKKAQEDYFAGGKIPKKTFEIKMERFKERQREIKMQLPVLRAKLKKLIKLKRLV